MIAWGVFLEDLSIGFLIVCLVLLLVISGFFSSSETGMMAINRYRLRHKAREGNRVAKKVQELLERPDRLLGVILIGNTFANVLASAIATVLAIRLFGEAGIAIATIVLTLLILLFSEITPKTLAASYPEKLSFVVVYPLAFLLKLLYPLVWSVNMVANGLLRLFRVKVKSQKIAEELNKDELRTVVDESVGEGAKHKQHKEMLLSVLDLEKITVNDVMLPRHEIVGINLNAPWDNILEQLLSAKHAKLPIYFDSVEAVVGIFYLSDALKLLSRNRLTKQAMIKAAKEPYFIPEGMPLNKQLQKFRDNETRMALVVDEYGDIIGLVTVEDILEEIVGELDSNVTDVHRFVAAKSDGRYVVNCAVLLRELNKHMNWSLPESGPKTLGGLIVEHLETIPESHVSLKVGNYLIEVIEIKGNRVIKASVRVAN